MFFSTFVNLSEASHFDLLILIKAMLSDIVTPYKVNQRELEVKGIRRISWQLSSAFGFFTKKASAMKPDDGKF